MIEDIHVYVEPDSGQGSYGEKSWRVYYTDININDLVQCIIN